MFKGERDAYILKVLFWKELWDCGSLYLGYFGQRILICAY